MPAAALPLDEPDRLEALNKLALLDTAPDPRFDAFTRVAAAIYRTPIALISLVDEDRQWFKSSFGLDVRETPRELAFCAHAILAPDEVLLVQDALSDPRFADNALVLGDPNIRFYAGAPLRTPEGHALGTICVMDRRPRFPSAQELAQLADLAVGVASAIELHRRLVEQTRIALHDPLTGLGNRAKFDLRLAGALAGAAVGGISGALLCIDLDRFKAINDTFGHPGGDAVLVEVARRLSGCVRGSDLVARPGGDEFSVLMGEPAGSIGAEVLAGRICDALEAPILIDGAAVVARCSVGIALYPQDGRDAPSLIRAADAALYRAKRAGRGCFRRFDPTLDNDAAARMALEADLRVAVETDAITLAWQKMMSLRPGLPGGYEVLARWDRPGFGPVPPDEFIPLAERCDLISRIDTAVLRKACAAAAAWPPGPRLSVNFSAAWFRDDLIVGVVADALAASGLAPDVLEIEVTERSLIEDGESARAVIGRLKQLGVRIALDDFGTGYSSLEYLARLPIDKIKLDRGFIRNIPDDPRACALARGVLALGHTLGLTLCAEGVETPRQLAFLRQAGFDEAQGFLVGRPAAGTPFPDETDAAAAE
jgi:diguanylate cyclase (GGDEF)-like protein